MADRRGGARGARGDRGGKGRQGNRDIGEKRAPAGRQGNGAGSRRRVANVGQASRWVGEGQMKAGATRGSGDPSASVSGRLEEWAALRLGRLVLLLVCISGLCRGLTPLGSAQARGPRHADPTGIVERQSVADALSRFRRGLLPSRVSGSSRLVRRRRTRTNDAGRCWKASEPAAGGRSSAAQ